MRTPWLIALFHVPWYNSNTAHQGEGDEMMSYMEPLLYAVGVDMVLAGHMHAYERSNRVHGGKSDRCGAVHVTIGDGGNSEGLARRCCLPELILRCMQVSVSLVELFEVPDRLVELIELVACPESGYLHLFSQQ